MTEDKILAEKLLSFHHHLRHNLLNDIQVIMGYLALNKREQLDLYLQQMVDHVYQQKRIAEIDYTPLAIFLLGLADNYPVHMEISIEKSLKITDEIGARYLYCLQEVFNYFRDDNITKVVFTKDNSVLIELASLENNKSVVELNSYLEKWDSTVELFDSPAHYRLMIKTGVEACL